MKTQIKLSTTSHFTSHLGNNSKLSLMIIINWNCTEQGVWFWTLQTTILRKGQGSNRNNWKNKWRLVCQILMKLSLGGIEDISALVKTWPISMGLWTTLSVAQQWLSVLIYVPRLTTKTPTSPRSAHVATFTQKLKMILITSCVRCILVQRLNSQGIRQV